MVTYANTHPLVLGPRSMSAEERKYIESGTCIDVLSFDAVAGSQRAHVQVCQLPPESLDKVAAGTLKSEPDWTLSPAS